VLDNEDMKRWLGPMVLASTMGLGAMIACSAAETPPDVPSYGPPNGIHGKTPAPPTGSSSGGSSGGSSGSSGGSSGSSGGSSGGSGAPATFACGTPVNGGTCNKSWTKDIYPKMKAGGAWGCGTASGCHGTQGGVLPYVDPSDEHATYVSLQKTMKNVGATELPYIDPCSTDPAQSLFVCNTLPQATACGASMPTLVPSVGQAATTTQDQADILTWVKCGAPEN
jgi:hypothetical protein